MRLDAGELAVSRPHDSPLSSAARSFTEDAPIRWYCFAILFSAAVICGCREAPPAVPETPPAETPSASDLKMTGTIVAQQALQVGKPLLVEGPSPSTQYDVVFEDDGRTGMFYAVDTKKTDVKIVDAVLIYNVDAVVHPEKSSKVEILWSGDGLKAALLINGYPHAVFDFETSRGYCRTGFPPPDPKRTKFSHNWNDAALDLFSQ